VILQTERLLLSDFDSFFWKPAWRLHLQPYFT